jgi:PilZ domain
VTEPEAPDVSGVERVDVSGSEPRERRAARRWLPEELPWPLACRIAPGQDALIVNLSAVGILVESDVPLLPGRRLTVQLIRPSRRVALTATVVRCFVVAVESSDGPLYHAGLAFVRWFEPLCELDSHAGEEDTPRAPTP